MLYVQEVLPFLYSNLETSGKKLRFLENPVSVRVGAFFSNSTICGASLIEFVHIQKIFLTLAMLFQLALGKPQKNNGAFFSGPATTALLPPPSSLVATNFFQNFF